MNSINELEILPLCLNRLKDPPKKLFFKGNLKLLDYPKVAIVGSRKCSKYTQNLVLNLATMLKKNNIVVVSGGAIGADIFAHQGSLPLSIGVFANSLDMIYPQQNESVIKKLYDNALALSEFEKEHKPKRYDFLLRNRIVVGLCDAVVIAQADIKSGSMSSANYAISANIPLFGLPQKLGESDGTNLLISKGKMQLLYDFDDFVKSLKNKNNIDLEQNSKDSTSQNDESFEDELLEFIQQNNDFNDVYGVFGTKVLEYELEGKIRVEGRYIRIL